MNIEKLIAGTIISVIIIAIVLVAYWALWHLWLFVLPQIWPSGPVQLISPGFWLFSGAWLLLATLGKAIFGRDKK